MNSAKLRRLRVAGWGIGSTKDFLKLSDKEARLMELKLSLAAQAGGLSKASFTQRIFE